MGKIIQKDKDNFLKKFYGDNVHAIHDEAWDRYFNKKHKKHAEVVKRLNWLEPNICGPRVIDVGCGSGIGSFICAKLKDVHEVYAVDVWDKTIDKAKEYIDKTDGYIKEKIKFFSCLAEELPFEDNFFNCAILGEVLEHVCNDDVVLYEVHRVLKRNGKIIITVPIDMTLSDEHIRAYTLSSLSNCVKRYFEICDIGKIGRWHFCIANKK